MASVVLCLGVAVSMPGALASPVPTSDPVYPSAKQVQDAKSAAQSEAAQVSAIQGHLAASRTRLTTIQNDAETAAETYNGAQVLLAKRTSAAKDAAARASAATRTAQAADNTVGSLAAQTYMQGGSLGGLEAFLADGGPQLVLDRASGLAVLGDIRTQALQQASAARSAAAALVLQANRTRAQQLAAAQAAQSDRDAAELQAQQAQAQTDAIGRQQRGMVAQLATLQHTSVALEGKRQAGLAAAARRRAEARIKAAQERAAAAAAAAQHRRDVAAAAAAARRQAAATSAAEAARAARAAKAARAAAKASSARALAAQAVRPSSPHHATAPVAKAPEHHSPPASSSSGVSAVIAFARAQIGKWYLWGGSGPSRFDCSGLTMMAWRRAGVYLDHYTGSQYASTRHVSVHSLRPGDLVFFGPSVAGIHHVGLYVGGGTMIEAPHTGARIRYASIWRSDLIPMAGRP